MARSGMVARPYHVSERHTCRLRVQWRGTQWYEEIYRKDEDALRPIIALATEYGQLRLSADQRAVAGRGWHVRKDRVQRI